MITQDYKRRDELYTFSLNLDLKRTSLLIQGRREAEKTMGSILGTTRTGRLAEEPSFSVKHREWSGRLPNNPPLFVKCYSRAVDRDRAIDRHTSPTLC